ncbi:MAG: EamA family transporter [Clostridia bacterium]|nr:EamA family transporter [Clostridia bacterium]
MKKHSQIICPALIILAGCFWGSMGIFVRKLGAFGFSSAQIVSIRLTLAALVFCLILLIKEPAGFKIQPKDIPLFLGLGLGSILFFTVCYFTAITMMPLSVAAILLYTSPIWIMLMSAVFFREKISGRKLAALALAFAGCVLVSGISGQGISLKGFFIGLGAGFGYGLYSILGTVALRRYSPFTVTAYTFIIAAAGSFAVCSPGDMFSKFARADNTAWLFLFCCLTALVTAVIPFLAYTRGLARTEPGKAGILATIEPVVATVIGIIVFAEQPTVISCTGIALILTAVIILNINNNKKEKNNEQRGES